MEESSGTVYLSDPLDDPAVIQITSIKTLVSMFPELQVTTTGDITRTGKFSLMRNAFLELAKVMDIDDDGDNTED